MKVVSDDYINKEEDSQRQPVELYHIFDDAGSVDWYLTDGDIEVVYDGNTYLPATLSSSSTHYDSKLEVTTLVIQASYLTEFVIEYISINPIELLWVSVLKLFRDQAPLEASVKFIGQIKDVSFQGVAGSINCVGFEHFLKMPIPVMRYQLPCNWRIFDENCKKVKADYKTTTIITLDATEMILTSADFALEEDGYFTGGSIEFGGEARTIISHAGSVIIIIYKMRNLVGGSSIDVYPGCDRRIETCRDNYDNIINFMGTPFIPVDNPAIRV